ncbi:hypothetical protein AVEN_135629-1 [Araneus ventricosus]|uniref:Uncharacterized protein n=1 Tax=Araneus ventricosus TaxID=182803 RepID=A0A4Y2J5Q9_ARAVE|nr:hypothetical protein AVEN_135629-1 [Araneus ventricosus]
MHAADAQVSAMYGAQPYYKLTSVANLADKISGFSSFKDFFPSEVLFGDVMGDYGILSSSRRLFRDVMGDYWRLSCMSRSVAENVMGDYWDIISSAVRLFRDVMGDLFG